MNNSSPLSQFFSNKWTKLTIAINVVIIIIIIIIAVDNAQKNATIKINIAPSDAEVTLNGQSFIGGTHQIKPGEYKVLVSHEEMTPKELIINVEGNSVTNLITFLSNEGNFDYYARAGNYSSFYKLSQIASAANNITIDQDKSAEEFISWFANAYNLYQTALPINYSEYETLEHGRSLTTDITIKRAEDGCNIILCIEALILAPSDKDGEGLANELMISNGLKLEDYEIKYDIY